MSGTSYGAVVLHVAPESAIGGPLALVQDGDLIRLDVAGRRLDIVVDEAELRRVGRAGSRPAHDERGYRLLHATACCRRTKAATSTSFAARRRSSRTPSPTSERAGPRHRVPRQGGAGARPAAGRAGYDVRATDLARPDLGPSAPGEPEDYWQADLTDAGAAIRSRARL